MKRLQVLFYLVVRWWSLKFSGCFWWWSQDCPASSSLSTNPRKPQYTRNPTSQFWAPLFASHIQRKVIHKVPFSIKPNMNLERGPSLKSPLEIARSFDECSGLMFSEKATHFLRWILQSERFALSFFFAPCLLSSQNHASEG